MNGMKLAWVDTASLWERRRREAPLWLGGAALVAWLGIAQPGALQAIPVADRGTTFTITRTAPQPAPGAEPPRFHLRGAGIIVARGLDQPDGIALARKGGVTFVSEEDAARIVEILPDGSRRTVIDRDTPVVDVVDGKAERGEGLRFPEGIALDEDGTLFVAEDTPGGRLIAYAPRETGYEGRVENLSMPGHRYAWESIDLGPKGEILLAGSTLEAESSADTPGFFEGIILYRDREGAWWSPYRRPLASFSAVAFFDGGELAAYACEISGEVGVIKLETRDLRANIIEDQFKSPEGICPLPDGSVIVAEESGRLSRVDPRAGSVERLCEKMGAIESIAWDASQNRLLVTGDCDGQLIALPVDGLAEGCASVEAIPFRQTMPAAFAPATCPGYIDDTLRRAGFDPERGTNGVTFQELARRLSMFAVDAKATLLHADGPVADPVSRIQFMVLQTCLLGFDDTGFFGPAGGLVAVMESGRQITTRIVERSALQVDLMEGLIEVLGARRVALPLPMGARMSSAGTASISFLGFGVTPDYFVVVNPKEPGLSYLFVMEPNGQSAQYRLDLPDRTGIDHWVIAVRPKGPEPWLRVADWRANVPAGMRTPRVVRNESVRGG